VRSKGARHVGDHRCAWKVRPCSPGQPWRFGDGSSVPRSQDNIGMTAADYFGCFPMALVPEAQAETTAILFPATQNGWRPCQPGYPAAS
jgi:hypothetical protein